MKKPTARVFVSSVMRDYEKFRDAASRSIELEGMEPVLAERFPASATSPRSACLDGVASCDAIVLLLGGRYGWTTPSGKSATQEEYEEAKKRDMPILVFIEAAKSREPKQEAFARSVQDYVAGHFRSSFSTEEELETQVRDALRNLDLSANDSVSAVRRVEQGLEYSPTGFDGPWLQGVWAPLRKEEVNDPIRFSEKAFQDAVHRLAHDGSPALLDYAESKTVEADLASKFRIQQGMQSQHAGAAAQLEIYVDGTVSIGAGLRSRPSTYYAVFDSFYLDPDVVRERILASCRFLVGWWSHMDPYRRHDVLIYNVALRNCSGKKFEASPDHSTSISLGTDLFRNENDPIVAFDNPRRISQNTIAEPEEEIDRVIELFRRRFAARWKEK